MTFVVLNVCTYFESASPGYSRCASYTGSICRGIILDDIFASHTPSQSDVQSMLAPLSGAVILLPTAYGCRDALMSVVCHQAFPRCETDTVRNQLNIDANIPLPAFPSQTACQHAVTSCTTARQQCLLALPESSTLILDYMYIGVWTIGCRLYHVSNAKLFE